ncbi:MAG: DNA repair protein RecO [Bacilli bacterium]|nr:DNA repair protein RecO [Bacilli bacterium]
MKCIIISTKKYKEKDALITAITEKEVITFHAKSVLDSKSKFTFLNVPLSKIDVTFIEGKYKYPLMKEASIVSSPLKNKSTLYQMSLLMLIQEAINGMLQEEEKYLVYPILSDILDNLDKNVSPQFISIYFLCHLLKISGYEFELNRCLFCGEKKDIVAFSFKDGGFVCRNCITDDIDQDLTVEQMKIILALFKSQNISDLSKYEFLNEDIMDLFNKLNVFIIDNYSIRLRSLDLLNN